MTAPQNQTALRPTPQVQLQHRWRLPEHRQQGPAEYLRGHPEQVRAAQPPLPAHLQTGLQTPQDPAQMTKSPPATGQNESGCHAAHLPEQAELQEPLQALQAGSEFSVEEV
ncbi:MAG TPA: hypothetical protein DIT89_15430, partial [Planctomycetaceae bacterium]|nr:hypothetical protein [Planctomycetaceae bacterium]